jgi:Cofactor assembly of complex C subunit B, CCB2/CCB4
MPPKSKQEQKCLPKGLNLSPDQCNYRSLRHRFDLVEGVFSVAEQKPIAPSQTSVKTTATATDPNAVIRKLPIATGILGGLLLLTNRILSADLSAPQSRSDVVGTILSAVLILMGLLWERIQPSLPETVVLEGTEGLFWADDLPDTLKAELAWASKLLLKTTVTRTVIVCQGDRVLLRRGVLPNQTEVKPGTIVKRVLETGKPIYLVALKLYPGRVEFDYLPANTQGVICQPLGPNAVMILAANAPRSYTQQDEAWIAGIAEKLAYSLQSQS